MAGEAAGAEPDRGDAVEPSPRGARGLDAFRDRPAEIVVGQRLGRLSRRIGSRCAGRRAAWCRDRAAGAAVGGLDHLMHAEEAARGLDPVEARLPQRRSARRRAPPARRSAPGRWRCSSIAAGERDQHDLERQLRPRPAGGCRTASCTATASAAIDDRRRPRVSRNWRKPPAKHAGQHQQRRPRSGSDIRRCRVKMMRRDQRRQRCRRCTPPSEIHR